MNQPFTDAEYVREESPSREFIAAVAEADIGTAMAHAMESEALIGQFDGFEVSEACSGRCGATFTASGPDGDRIAALVAAWRTDHRHSLI